MPSPRKKLNPQPETKAASTKEARSRAFISSGSYLLNLVLGGGYAVGRIVNVVGDRSSGKTLLAIEAAANCAQMSPVTNIRYAEAEAAFDEQYAASIGMPEGLQIASGIETVEDWYDDLNTFLDGVDRASPSLYILDSLDALSDDAEMERDIDKGSYGASKARKLSEMFRRLVRKIEEAHCTLLIISQVRDKLNVSFGETKTRSGGRALDFYASQILWLAEIEKIKRSVLSVERVVGVWVEARTKKNKVGNPFRSATIQILFQYGVMDGHSMIGWLKKNKVPGVEYDEVAKQLSNALRGNDRQTLLTIEADLREKVGDRWQQIEDALRPGMAKYQ